MIYNILHILETTKQVKPELSAHDAYQYVLAALSDEELREVKRGLFEMVHAADVRLSERALMRSSFRKGSV